MIQILVRNMQDRIFPLEVNVTDTISSVKAKIKVGFSQDAQHSQVHDHPRHVSM